MAYEVPAPPVCARAAKVSCAARVAGRRTRLRTAAEYRLLEARGRVPSHAVREVRAASDAVLRHGAVASAAATRPRARRRVTFDEARAREVVACAAVMGARTVAPACVRGAPGLGVPFCVSPVVPTVGPSRLAVRAEAVLVVCSPPRTLPIASAGTAAHLPAAVEATLEALPSPERTAGRGAVRQRLAPSS